MQECRTAKECQSLAINTDKRILALGAESAGVFCTVDKGDVATSICYGNTMDHEPFSRFKKAVKNIIDSGFRPDVILCDKHPQYNTTMLAEQLSKELGVKLVKIQHHAAHAYASASEFDINDYAAIVCDGMGFGDDGNIWGGEVFVGNRRVGHLQEQHLLGGDSATEQPAKFLYSILYNSMSKRELHKVLSDHFKAPELEILRKQMKGRFNCPLTSSCGRVFDSAAVLLGVCERREEGPSPAMLLENASGGPEVCPYPLAPVITRSSGCDVLMTTPLFDFLVESLGKPWADRSRLAVTVQRYIAEGLYLIAKKHASTDSDLIFTGGCAHNKIMRSYLNSKGVLKNKRVTCGDGSIALGQVLWYVSLGGE